MKLLSERGSGSVRQALMEQFEIGRESAKRAIAMARLIMAEQVIEEAPEVRAVTIARLEHMIDAAEDAGDYRSAIRGIHELARIYGLHQPEELIVSQGPRKEVLAELTDEQIDALAALEEAEQRALRPKASN